MTEQVGSGLRALVIEDEEVVRAVVVEVLEGMGFVVAAAVSLGDARAKLTQAQTDLLVVDKNLPDGSGLLLARARRNGLSWAPLLASIDRFRDINASLGFAGGDALLRALGAFLLRSGRASDVPAYLGSGVMARFAGDTFALLLPETDRTGGAI